MVERVDTMLVRRALRLFPWLLALALLLVACDTPTPTPVAAPLPPSGGNSPVYAPPSLVPLQTATPTATPTPTATLTPTASPTPTPVCSETVGRVETGVYRSQILGRDMAYRIYLPACYDAYGLAYPVLYLLHGHPFDERHWSQLGVESVADDGIRATAYPPFIIVLPNCDPSPEGIFVNTSGGDNSVEGLIVNELIPHIDSTYRTQAQREGRAIGGISRGAVWSLEIAFRHPELFAAVGAHSAALALNYPHPLYDPYNLAAEPAVAALRIWLDAGDADWARTGTERLHQLLAERGVAHEYLIGEGSHENDYWSRMLPAYLAFYVAGWPRQ